MEDLLKIDELNANNSTRMNLDKINMLLENIFSGGSVGEVTDVVVVVCCDLKQNTVYTF